MNLWAEKNVSTGGMKMLFGVQREIKPSSLRELHSTVSQKLDQHFSPILYFAAPNKGFKNPNWIHVMQVYKIEPIASDGSYVMHVWDVNYLGGDAARQVSVMAKGEVFYGDRKLSYMNPVPGDEKEMESMLINMVEFCGKHPELCPK